MLFGSLQVHVQAAAVDWARRMVARPVVSETFIVTRDVRYEYRVTAACNVGQIKHLIWAVITYRLKNINNLSFLAFDRAEYVPSLGGAENLYVPFLGFRRENMPPFPVQLIIMALW